MRNKGVVTRLQEAVRVGVVLALFYGFLSLVGVRCPIRFLTGISCPGCGMTRAWIHLVCGDVRGAFAYHPLVLVPAAAFVIYLWKDRFKDRTIRLLTAAAVVLFLAVYVIRAADPSQDVVVVRPRDGFIYRMIAGTILN